MPFFHSPHGGSQASILGVSVHCPTVSCLRPNKSCHLERSLYRERSPRKFGAGMPLRDHATQSVLEFELRESRSVSLIYWRASGASNGRRFCPSARELYPERLTRRIVRLRTEENVLRYSRPRIRIPKRVAQISIGQRIHFGEIRRDDDVQDIFLPRSHIRRIFSRVAHFRGMGL